MDASNLSTQIRSPETIEQRIAASLRDFGRFHEPIKAEELAVILESVVSTLFSEQKVVGVNVGITHSITGMEVYINNAEANVCFLVRIHKPIVAAIKFSYSLINDPVSIRNKLVVKKGTLQVVEITRRFDLKAKAALAAIDVDYLARQELSDLGGIILKTLPPQLESHGVEGIISEIGLALTDTGLDVYLEGEFQPIITGD
jgi:predicted DNA-binding transcriptional regulator